MAIIQFYKVDNFKEYSKKQKAFYKEVQFLTSREEIESLCDAKDCNYGQFGERQLKLRSKIHPAHKFWMGFFDTGQGPDNYSRILNDATGMTIHDVFVQDDKTQDEVDDGNIFQPTDWNLTVIKIHELKKAYADYLQKRQLEAVFWPSLRSAATPEEAISIFMQRLAINDFADTIGVVPSVSSFNHGVYCIKKTKNPVHDEYLKGIEIVEETIDYIWKERDNYAILILPYNDLEAL